MNNLRADAQPIMCNGLRLLLEQHPGWRIAGEAEDTQTLLEHLRFDRPKLIMLDLELPGMLAQDLLITVRQACPSQRVVFMSGKDELHQMAVQAGSDVFAYKADPREKLLGLIRGLVNS